MQMSYIVSCVMGSETGIANDCFQNHFFLRECNSSALGYSNILQTFYIQPDIMI